MPDQIVKPQWGVAPSQLLSRYARDGVIRGQDTVSGGNVQPASIDLSLGEDCYRLQSSFLPQSQNVRDGMKDLVMYSLNITDGAILERGAVYLIPLRERLHLPTNVMGKTNPKSSTGRLDVFTRVITDKCRRFEEIAPGYDGELFLEVVPRSFTIKVKAGQRLNQLRLFTLSPAKVQARGAGVIVEESLRCRDYISGQELKEIYYDERLLFDASGKFIGDHDRHISEDGLLMSVDLGEGGPIGYKAKKNSHVIDLEKIGEYEIEDFWETLHAPKSGRFILEPEEFYIFASKEHIRVPLDYSAEMVEFDAGSGELRTHYAGFFDPGFGYGKSGEMKGTKAVLEVRPHDVPFIIEDGQILFKMKYEPMLEKPELWYGSEIGSNYHNQTLRLSKQFLQE